MALSPEVTTRVDQLHADLRRIHKRHAGRAGAPDPSPMFRRDADGTVRDRAGNPIYKPAAK